MLKRSKPVDLLAQLTASFCRCQTDLPPFAFFAAHVNETRARAAN
jgi:hypothetical protein